MSGFPPPPPPPAVPSVPAVLPQPVGVLGALVRCDFPVAQTIGVTPQVTLYTDRATFGLTIGRDWLVTEQVGGVRVDPTVDTYKETPGWAVVLGIIGIFFFLIGLVFFFVKVERQRPAAVVSVWDRSGRVVAVRALQDASVLAAQLGVRLG